MRVRSGDAGPVSVSPWVEGTGFSQQAAPASAHAEAASSPWRGDWGALTTASPSPQVHIPPPCSGAAPASAPPGPLHCPRDPSLRAAPRSAERRAGLLSPVPELGSGVHFMCRLELNSGRSHSLLPAQCPTGRSSGAPGWGPAGTPAPSVFPIRGPHLSPEAVWGGVTGLVMRAPVPGLGSGDPVLTTGVAPEDAGPASWVWAQTAPSAVPALTEVRVHTLMCHCLDVGRLALFC